MTLENPGNANYDPVLGVPRCTAWAPSCDSVELLDGRGASSAPSTTRPTPWAARARTATEGLYGLYQFDPSLERLKVSRADGTPFAPARR